MATTQTTPQASDRHPAVPKTFAVSPDATGSAVAASVAGEAAAALSSFAQMPSSSGRVSSTGEVRLQASAPLSAVVTDAVQRWHMETSKEALKGDVKQQALLGQMLAEGYGCEPNAATSKIWIDKARKRGYRLAGVYCEL